MGKCLTLFFLLVFVNALICLLFLKSQKLLVTSVDAGPEDDDTKEEYLVQTNDTVLSAHPTQPEIRQVATNPAYPFEYIINPSLLCVTEQRRKIAILVLVHSATGNRAERLAIRNTWGSPATAKGNKGTTVRIAFLLGATSNGTIQASVFEEASTYHDIIQADFQDSYQNLTLKSIMMLKWTSEHCDDKALFLLKTDDDMYVNLPNLFKIMGKSPASRNAMFGILFRKAVPFRNPKAKWFVPKSQFPGNVFPDYLSGTAYVMTADVVSKLYRTSLTKPFLAMEDVFITGICASSAGVRRYQIKGFSHRRRPPKGCAFRDAVTGHHVAVKQMKVIWRELSNKTKMAQCPSASAVRRLKNKQKSLPNK